MAELSQPRQPGMRVATGLYRGRRLRNQVIIVFAYGATFIGLGALAIILGTLVFKGASGLSLSAFTEMTRPTGSNGGLYNAIVGSLVLTVLGVVIGTPLGILAGTYMAEYGRFSKLTHVVRFINDILLSAPSIVVGLFVYDVMVVPMGHFSGISGAVALALLVAPVVVRTTEDMLSLVPRELREAASALGMPRAYVIAKVSYRAAIAGIVTGILLAVARVSGETAPLLFTAFNHQFFGEFPYINSPMASLPAVIFQYAMSPYPDWQQLAWTGALIITVAVLALSITARALASSRKVA
jgi:phosphate transport system permease protein